MSAITFEHPEIESLDRDGIVATQRRIIRATERLLLSLFPQLGEHHDYLQPITMLYFGMINWTANACNSASA